MRYTRKGWVSLLKREGGEFAAVIQDRLREVRRRWAGCF
jgi:hypothetical protein